MSGLLALAARLAESDTSGVGRFDPVVPRGSAFTEQSVSLGKGDGKEARGIGCAPAALANTNSCEATSAYSEDKLIHEMLREPIVVHVA